MLSVVCGRLARDPEIRKVTAKGKNGKEDRELLVSNNTVFIWNGRKTGQDVPVDITAWEEMCGELAKYKKGDLIQFVGEVSDTVYTPKNMEKGIVQLGYTILKFDHGKTIIKQSNRLLRAYITGEIPEIYQLEDKREGEDESAMPEDTRQIIERMQQEGQEG